MVSSGPQHALHISALVYRGGGSETVGRERETKRKGNEGVRKEREKGEREERVKRKGKREGGERRGKKEGGKVRVKIGEGIE